MNFDLDLDTFATQQSAVQAQHEHGLYGSARSALRRVGTDGWYNALLARAEGVLRARYRSETGRRTSPALREAVTAFHASMVRTLDRTRPVDIDELDQRAHALAASISTAAVNMAVEIAGHEDDTPDTQLEKVWLSMEDEKVRPTHAAAHGQAVPMNRSFVVGESKLARPGDTSAAIGEWINCRCIMAVRKVAEAMVAAADKPGSDAGRSLPEGNTGVGIFAIAADDDPIRDVSTEDPPHITTLWLGSIGSDFTGDIDQIKEEVAAAVQGVPPFTLRVTGRDSLGDEGADVLTLEAGDLGDLREDMLQHPSIKAAQEAATQFPEWIVHLTLGYPDNPAKSDTVPESITFDRMGVWFGDEKSEYALNGEAPAMNPDDQQQQDAEAPPALAEDERLSNDADVPWHGVFAPEATLSGDGRRFSAGALRRRPLPLPLSWQKPNMGGHDASVVVAKTLKMVRVGDEIRATGVFLSTVPEADEAIGLVAEMGRMGVSIDADDGSMEYQTRNGDSVEDLMDALEPEGEGIDLEDVVTQFTDARICGATLCHIPAFKEAWVSLGDAPEGFMDGEDVAEEGVAVDESLAASATVVLAISEKPWDGSASRFTDEEWKRSCTVHLADTTTKSDHKVPILEPNGDLSRAGVHAAASRINQVDAPAEKISAAKAKIRSAYSQLDEEPPDSLASNVTGEFVKTEDGPGWITHPVDTDRLRDYWTRGAGATEIGWGTPGDFNRCRARLAAYVKPQYLSGYCANRHYDALGFWPGNPVSAETIAASAAPPEGETMAPALHLVASVQAPTVPPLDWFSDPGLIAPSPIVVTEEGRFFGHLAAWGTCHIGIDGVCIEPPPSNNDYASFKQGSVMTDKGLIPCGVITMETGHADVKMRARPAMAHYDNTGTQAALVNIGEDEHGIWVAGCVMPDLDDVQIMKMRAAALSGDWRDIGGNLELVAALEVNTPGFPIPRPALAASGGHQTSLVAAGVIRQPKTVAENITVEAIVAAVFAEQERREAVKAMDEFRAEWARKELARIKASIRTEV